jgi:hypothetical protein
MKSMLGVTGWVIIVADDIKEYGIIPEAKGLTHAARYIERELNL